MKPTSELWSIICHMRTQVNVPDLTPARQANTLFTYPEGMEDWLDRGGC